MTVLDVTQKKSQVTELAWCPNPRWNLIKNPSVVNGGINIKPELLKVLNYDEDSMAYISSKENAENYIKALQAAIELNWFK